MADPITTVMGVSAGVGAMSSLFGGGTQASNYNAQAQAADYQAAMLTQQAQETSAQGTNKQNLQAEQATKMLGTQKAAIGQSNLGFNGTMADIMDESEAKAQLDRYNIAYDTEVQTNNLNDQANMSKYQANIARSNAKQSLIGGVLGAFGSVAGGIGTSMYLRNK